MNEQTKNTIDACLACIGNAIAKLDTLTIPLDNATAAYTTVTQETVAKDYNYHVDPLAPKTDDEILSPIMEYNFDDDDKLIPVIELPHLQTQSLSNKSRIDRSHKSRTRKAAKKRKFTHKKMSSQQKNNVPKKYVFKRRYHKWKPKADSYGTLYLNEFSSKQQVEKTKSKERSFGLLR